MNQPACRAVYQDVTGWGGRRRAVRAGSRMGMGRHAASGKFQRTRTLIKNGAGDLFGIITTPTGVITVNDRANILELFRS